MIDELYQTILNRKSNAKEGSYTTYLFEKGLDKILKKVGEEATEVVLAAKNQDKEELANEAADLLFHTLVALAEVGVTPSDVKAVLESREGKQSNTRDRAEITEY
ncbi:phosphoribosyl-ATP pyrophosphatase [Pilibacter termitis]|uniref:Phosphoribosyl-ATP pyrophosphatase n=1 Tax=Pilibacter termitis TaxID=263852 RepID=A0A1T4LR26_9ENTE|nr:phosphoribosyl-ATP diphosphatase [Pilibacter termitis]SJZ56894.1 phosphoribosyl-ATP pyrophosphatase [Pilibacter termitis]